MKCGFCTYEVQDPAHGAVPAAGQHPEVGDVPEEVQPADKHGSIYCKNPLTFF